jgi:hypothetical protein
MDVLEEISNGSKRLNIEVLSIHFTEKSPRLTAAIAAARSKPQTPHQQEI